MNEELLDPLTSPNGDGQVARAFKRDGKLEYLGLATQKLQLQGHAKGVHKCA